MRELWNMQHQKCCYSEVPIPESGHGKAVEHFDPKSIFKWKRNQWTNLLLVCPHCNGRKSDRFPVMLTNDEHDVSVIYVDTPTDVPSALINPASAVEDEDPERHLTYNLNDIDPLYGQVTERRESVRGRITIEVTGIDDDVFVRERFAYLNDTLEPCYRNLLRARRASDADAARIALDSFRGFMSPTAKFAGLAREFARAKKLDEHFGLNIPGVALG